jgi:NADPH-dependent ferric siderophore reductase
MISLIAEARARASVPEALIARFRDRMTEYGMDVTGPVAHSRIALPGGIAVLRLEPGSVALRIEAADHDRLADAKNVVSGQLDSCVPEESLGIIWTGDGVASGPAARPHNFRALQVVRSFEVTPRLRRITFHGEGLERFAPTEQMHVKLLIPIPGIRPGLEPLWPRVSPSGQPLFDDCLLNRRTYTIRRVDPVAGTLDIDFVLHGDAGPGSRFATDAAAGDWLGIMGPGGGTVPTEGWVFLAGDETARPAIARGLEAMPRDARGLALIEVADAAEEERIDHPPGVALRWLHRNGAAHGTLLEAAVRAAAWPDGETVSAWAACENLGARGIREYWSRERGLPGDRYRAVAYWRQDTGKDGEAH